MQDSGSLAVFKVAARDQGHNKGPSGAFVTYCNISCLIRFFNNKNIHCDPSLELPRRDGSNEGSQLLFFGEYAKLSLNYPCYPILSSSFKHCNKCDTDQCDFVSS